MAELIEGTVVLGFDPLQVKGEPGPPGKDGDASAATAAAQAAAAQVATAQTAAQSAQTAAQTAITSVSGAVAAEQARADALYPPARKLTRTEFIASTTVSPAGTIVSDGVDFYLANGVTPDNQLPPNFLLAPYPKGAGQSDGDDLVTLAAYAKAQGKAGIMLRSGTYRFLDKEYLFPGGTSFLGPGDDLVLLQMNTGASIRFGAFPADVPGNKVAARFSKIGGFRVNGGGNAVTPLRFGYNTASCVEDIRVANAAAGGPAVLSQLGQNTVWQNIEVSQNLGDGLTLDMSMANHTFMHCIVRDNIGAGLTLDQSATPPQGTTNAGAPRNIKWFGGLMESNNGPNVYAKAWGQIDFIGAQTSHSAGIGTPSFYMSDELAPGMPGSNINWIGGQLKGGSNDGVGARVMKGTLNIVGGAALNSAQWAIEVGAKGQVNLDGYSMNSLALLRGVVLADNTPSAAVSSTFDCRSQVWCYGKATFGPTTDFSTTTATLATIPGCSIPLQANTFYKVTADLEQVGDPGTNGDLKLAWDFPSGSGWTVRYKVAGLPAASTTSTGQVTRDISTQGVGTNVGTIATLTGVEVTAYVYTGTVAGNLALQAAQRAASTTATVVYATSRMQAERTVG